MYMWQSAIGHSCAFLANEWVHTELKPYICVHSKMAFSSSSRITLHKRSHADGRELRG